MGIKRFMWRSTSIGRIIDTVTNIVDEGSITEGLKRTYKEDICEDNPLTAQIYNMGRCDGKHDGYTEASQQYETKLLKQADEFLKQTKIFEDQRDAYNQLLNEYDVEIENLRNKVYSTEKENEYLSQLLKRKEQLSNLKDICN